MSSHGWNGADPTEQDAGVGTDYELGTQFRAEADISITAVRVWHGTSAGDVSRTGRIWSSGGVQQASTALASHLPSGWSEYTLASPFGVHAGSSIWVTYNVLEFYGATLGVTYPVSSGDGLVTALGQAFNDTPGSFPNQVFGSVFYGVDIVYTPGLPGADPLTASLSVTMAGLAATATFSADRTATYLVEWGDGTSSVSSSAGSLTHTYAQPGDYVVLLTATAVNDGTVDAAAAIAYARLVGVLDPTAIVGALVTHAQATGLFERILGHETANAPGNGLTCDFVIAGLDPVASSGLAATSVRVTAMARVYLPAAQRPYDGMDPRVLDAGSGLFTSFIGDLDLGGAVSWVDVRGMYGVSLGGRQGWVRLGDGQYRAITLTIPLIVNDVYTEAS